MVDRGADFSSVAPAEVGQSSRYTYRYPMEPVFAPDSTNPDRSYVITVVFDGDRQCSEVWILDSDRLDSEPICRLALPSIMPMGFHGIWRSL